jgi:hypothetical protein
MRRLAVILVLMLSACTSTRFQDNLSTTFPTDLAVASSPQWLIETRVEMRDYMGEMMPHLVADVEQLDPDVPVDVINVTYRVINIPGDGMLTDEQRTQINRETQLAMQGEGTYTAQYVMNENTLQIALPLNGQPLTPQDVIAYGVEAVTSDGVSGAAGTYFAIRGDQVYHLYQIPSG